MIEAICDDFFTFKVSDSYIKFKREFLLEAYVYKNLYYDNYPLYDESLYQDKIQPKHFNF